MRELHKWCPKECQNDMQNQGTWRRVTKVQVLEHTPHNKTMRVHGDVAQIPHEEPMRNGDVPPAYQCI